jgi:hypothetical protein
VIFGGILEKTLPIIYNEITLKKQKRRKTADKPKKLMNILKGTNLKETDLQEFYKASVTQKSKKNKKRFLDVPFSERIILLPQCLRNIKGCKAKEVGNQYECQECGACKIAKITQIAKKLGYKGIYILKGGRAVIAMIEQISPRAILGIACYYEGLIGMTECESRGIPVQFVPLTKDGCVNTDLKLSVLENFVKQKSR